MVIGRDVDVSSVAVTAINYWDSVMQQSSFDLHASKRRVLAAYSCLLAYVLDVAVTTGLGEKLLTDQALVELFHDLMVEADAIARSTSVH